MIVDGELRFQHGRGRGDGEQTGDGGGGDVSGGLVAIGAGDVL